MTIDNEPLAFAVRRHRRNYRDAGLTQMQVAHLAGVSRRAVQDYERSTRLPSSVECVLRTAIALGTTVEQLIAGHLLEELRADVEARRLDSGWTGRHGTTGVGDGL